MPPEKIITFVIGAIAIIAGAYYTTYFIASRTKRVAHGRAIKVLDRFSLSKDKSILIIEVAGKVYLVAMSGGAITLLDALDSDAFQTAAEVQREQDAAASQPVDFVHKGVKAGVSAVKNSGFVQNMAAAWNRSRGVEVPEPKVRAADEEDELDAVFRKIQARKDEADSSETKEEDAK